MNNPRHMAASIRLLACLVAAVALFLVACGGETQGTVARRNVELHKMAMTVLSNPKVQTWKQLRAELEHLPDFPQKRLPAKTPEPAATGVWAQGRMNGRLMSGGDIARSIVFKDGKKPEDVDSCVNWSLYSQRGSLSGPPAYLSIFLDKDQNIVAFDAMEPGDH